jgi:hypothetical protein
MSNLNKIIKDLKKKAKKFTDKRSGKHQTHTIEDIVMSAFSIFFLQSPSWLSFQRTMEDNRGKNNGKSLFDIEKIPTDNHIRDTLDGIDEKEVSIFYNYLYTQILKDHRSIIDEYKFLNESLLVLLDGTYYHSSKTIHCSHCQTRKDEQDNIHYYHSAITPVIASPNKSSVFPLFPEMISNEDGEEKQDCEINAGKRWLGRKDQIINKYSIILLGDDIYSREPFINETKEKGHSFIFVCKDSSHKALYEYVNMADNLKNIDTVKITKRDKSNKKVFYTYRFLNSVPINTKEKSTEVNWCDVVVTKENGKKEYSGAFVTDLTIDKSNIEDIVKAGRCRWKIENENNNTLKTKGYHLEHNFGHGKKGLSELLLCLNIFAFLLHTYLLAVDDGYKKIYNAIGKREEFFNHIKTLTTFFYYKSWEDLFVMMIKGYYERIDACEFMSSGHKQ